jgi:hypothetical protein
LRADPTHCGGPFFAAGTAALLGAVTASAILSADKIIREKRDFMNCMFCSRPDCIGFS